MFPISPRVNPRGPTCTQVALSTFLVRCVLPVLSSHLLLATIEALYPRPALNDIANRSIDGNHNIDT
ncbi:uncharacterized protein N7525_003779 [Penicillium rubens]|jgi:hypothetical protein|uniref:uncharacterized protein n=1 Tax=Penicillium rubens TaxID=1108849 RepID=UPI002A5B0285|nr:uncharacterized protein N7525_003779 [Penicillium rubens]KAJ5838591.1 hypothetical protein N7525_003779 [Penicillium rubens]